MQKVSQPTEVKGDVGSISKEILPSFLGGKKNKVGEKEMRGDGQVGGIEMEASVAAQEKWEILV